MLCACAMYMSSSVYVIQISRKVLPGVQDIDPVHSWISKGRGSFFFRSPTSWDTVTPTRVRSSNTFISNLTKILRLQLLGISSQGIHYKTITILEFADISIAYSVFFCKSKLFSNSKSNCHKQQSHKVLVRFYFWSSNTTCILKMPEAELDTEPEPGTDPSLNLILSLSLVPPLNLNQTLNVRLIMNLNLTGLNLNIRNF